MDTATLPTALVNAPLMIATLGHIETHPEAWNQRHWRCGTTACFAGHAGILAGAQWALGPTDTRSYAPLPDGAVRLLSDGETDPHGRCMDQRDVTWVGDDGIRKVQRVNFYARHALGLTRAAANRLFDHQNKLRDIQSIVHELIAESAR